MHQLRHVHEAGESRIEPVAGAVRREFQRRHGLSKRRGPRVEVLQVALAQHIHLEEPLEREHFGHRVRDRCSRGEDDAPTTVRPLHVLHFQEHIKCSFRCRLR